MSSQLLTTKLYVPRAHPNLVARPRLSERLKEGMRRKMTLISAPAGFGKTTLLSEWRMLHLSSEWPLAWVSLDEGDNDPELLEAVWQLEIPEFKKTLRALAKEALAAERKGAA